MIDNIVGTHMGDRSSQNPLQTSQRVDKAIERIDEHVRGRDIYDLPSLECSDIRRQVERNFEGNVMADDLSFFATPLLCTFLGGFFPGDVVAALGQRPDEGREWPDIEDGCLRRVAGGKEGRVLLGLADE